MNKKIAHCKKCKEPLYQMITTPDGTYYPASQCLNHSCKNYGIPQRGNGIHTAITLKEKEND